MALQVWLPFNEDFHDQGLGNLIITNYNAIIDNNGKIGKCCSFNGIDSHLIADFAPGIIVPNEMSFCCWIKLNTIKNQCLFSSRVAAGAGLTFFMLEDHKLRFDNMANKKYNTYQTTFNYEFSTNIWYHIAVIQTTTQRKLYVNGILQQSINKVSANNGGNTATKCIIGASGINDNANNNWLDGYLNDIRIYDHALSDKEIEEIAKGLILHYKLDNIIDNNIDDCSGYNYNGIISGDGVTLSNNIIKYSNSISLPTNNWIRILSRPTIICPNDAITVNIWANIAASWTYNRGCIISCQESGGWAIGKSKNNQLYFQIYDNGEYKNAIAESNYTSTIFGEWHMFTGTADNSYIRFFLDGKLIAETQKENTETANFSYNNNYIFIGAEAKANTVTPYASINGLFSDARIYATALTEEQVKELYDTSVTIDNLGNVYAREFDENLNLNITKTGLFQATEIKDGDYEIASILKDTYSIQGRNLYEY